MQDLGNEIRNKEGAGAWMKRLIEKFEEGKDYIIDGIRNPGEVKELKQLKNFYLIVVDAPREIRFQRFLERARPSDPKTWEGFLEIDKRDFEEEDPLGQQVGKCMEMADFKIINNFNLEVFEEKLLQIYNQIIKSIDLFNLSDEKYH